ncbi:hypothetical protein [Moorena sp. SIO4E2]|uniref:hypothetical protein n=1 Tax=Moorena sp. SIO4E2 TaxID=2607826 RepID=UPI0025801886|nr:hypothetical protein [Moorena sp. SIO4E2]
MILGSDAASEQGISHTRPLHQDNKVHNIFCLLPIAYSLLPIAYCLFPIAYCLFPIPYSLFPIPSTSS